MEAAKEIGVAQKIKDKIEAVATKMTECSVAARRLKRGNGWNVLVSCESITFYGEDQYGTSAERIKKMGITTVAFPSASMFHPFQFFRITFDTKNGDAESARAKVFEFYEHQMHTLGVSYHVAFTLTNVALHQQTFIYEIYI